MLQYTKIISFLVKHLKEVAKCCLERVFFHGDLYCCVRYFNCCVIGRCSLQPKKKTTKTKQKQLPTKKGGLGCTKMAMLCHGSINADRPCKSTSHLHLTSGYPWSSLGYLWSKVQLLKYKFLTYPLGFIIYSFFFWHSTEKPFEMRGPWHSTSSLTLNCFFRFLTPLVVWFTVLFFGVNLRF